MGFELPHPHRTNATSDNTTEPLARFIEKLLRLTSNIDLVSNFKLGPVDSDSVQQRSTLNAALFSAIAG
jgi:hypothetical protein